jgi:hypothetical protein
MSFLSRQLTIGMPPRNNVKDGTGLDWSKTQVCGVVFSFVLLVVAGMH